MNYARLSTFNKINTEEEREKKKQNERRTITPEMAATDLICNCGHTKNYSLRPRQQLIRINFILCVHFHRFLLFLISPTSSYSLQFAISNNVVVVVVVSFLPWLNIKHEKPFIHTYPSFIFKCFANANPNATERRRRKKNSLSATNGNKNKIKTYN